MWQSGTATAITHTHTCSQVTDSGTTSRYRGQLQNKQRDGST